MLNGEGDTYLESDFPSVPIYLVGSKNDAKNADLRETNLLSLSYGNIVPKDIAGQKGLLPASFDGYQVVQPGYTILRFTDLQNDQKSLRSGLVTERGIITSAYIGFKPDTHLVVPTYFAYVMRALDVRKVFYQMGFGVRQSLGWDEFSAMRIPLPDLTTQRCIAEYLDSELGEIDAMVAKFEKLIADLEARKMKRIDSVIYTSDLKLRLAPLGVFLAEPIKDGPHETPEFIESGVPFLSVDGIQNGELTFDGCRYISVEDHEKYSKKAKPGKGDILMGKAASTGKIAQIKTGREFNIWSPLAIIRPNNALDSRWLTLVLKSTFSQQQINDLSTFNTQRNIAMGDIPRIKIPVVDLARQREVADELTQEIVEMDTLIARSRTLIDDLKARKSALITEVVTGRKQV